MYFCWISWHVYSFLKLFFFQKNCTWNCKETLERHYEPTLIFLRYLYVILEDFEGFSKKGPVERILDGPGLPRIPLSLNTLPGKRRFWFFWGHGEWFNLKAAIFKYFVTPIFSSGRMTTRVRACCTVLFL